MPSGYFGEAENTFWHPPLSHICHADRLWHERTIRRLQARARPDSEHHRFNQGGIMPSDAELNPDFAVCRVEIQKDGGALNYMTLAWGYDTQSGAIGALERISKEENIPMDELAVIGVVMAHDLNK